MGHSEWLMTQVTHWALDPWPMWPMTHGSPGPSPHTSASLTQIYRLPALYLDIVYVDTPLSCYIIPHVSKMHTQAPVNLEFWYIIIAIIYKPSHRVKNWWVMGQHLVTHDPCDPSDFRDPFDPWPMTHRPIPCSGREWYDYHCLFIFVYRCRETALVTLTQAIFRWCIFRALEL